MYGSLLPINHPPSNTLSEPIQRSGDHIASIFAERIRGAVICVGVEHDTTVETLSFYIVTTVLPAALITGRISNEVGSILVSVFMLNSFRFFP
jgi:hypothetical protein